MITCDISPGDFWWHHENGDPIALPPAMRTTARETPALEACVQKRLRELLNNYGTIDVPFICGPAHGLRELAWDRHPPSAILRLPGKADCYLSLGGGSV